MYNWIENENALNQFKKTYNLHASGLIFYARKFTDQQTAEDIVHDVFLKIWDKKQHLILEDEIKTYLIRAVQNACFDYLKHVSVENDYISKVSHELKLEELEFYDNASNRLVLEDQIAAIHQAVDKLPDKCKQIFTLSYLENKKNAEIAEILNISIRTVESQLYKALKQLRKNLSPSLMIIIILKLF